MASAPRSSRSKRVDSDPLGDLLENMKQNPIPGLFTSPSTDNDNTVVVLDDWWLVRPNVEGGLKKVAVAGHIAKKESEVHFTSAQIIKRHDTFILEAADGITVKVEGMINRTNTQNNGFSHEVCQRFNIGPISTDGKDAEDSATPEKGDTVRDTKLQTAGKRENVIPESKVLDTAKGSSNKDCVPQSTSKMTRRGSSHTNMEVHGAIISPSPSESNIRRSRSGRAIIPSIDKGSQTVVYDQSGNFTGIVSPVSISKGGTSKPSKKRRF